jgi:DNA mismatch endonuclease (patch repair protein)
MAKIRDRNTKPELVLRKALFALGLRYRLHQKDLPGTPDLVFPKYGAVVFIHGCFWHGHSCKLFVTPATNREFWTTKIGQNRDRDKRALSQLGKLGWRVLTVWECALRGPEKTPVDEVAQRVKRWLSSQRQIGEVAQATRRSSQDSC